MEQTLHRSLDTLLGYFKDEEQRNSRAARLLWERETSMTKRFYLGFFRLHICALSSLPR
jgi:hypothetical protein